MRLEQLHEQTATHTEAETTMTVRWRDWLRELAARPLDGDTAGAVVA